MTAPLRDRFGVINRLEFYTVDELADDPHAFGAGAGRGTGAEEGAREMARRSRGTPRLANRLLKRVRDFAQVKYDGCDHERGGRLSPWISWKWINMGLDQMETVMILTAIIEKFSGGPVGLDTLAAALGEDAGNAGGCV